jgi:hypothetical protein
MQKGRDPFGPPPTSNINPALVVLPAVMAPVVPEVTNGTAANPAIPLAVAVPARTPQTAAGMPTVDFDDRRGVRSRRNACGAAI